MIIVVLLLYIDETKIKNKDYKHMLLALTKNNIYVTYI